MADVDLVARLQLNAQQFSASTDAAMKRMQDAAARTASGLPQPFVKAFADVNKLATQALTMPRTASGSLDLSGEIASLRAAAVEADRNAMALRELRDAQTAAAAAGRGNISVLQQDAEASRLAAEREEAAASAARQRVVSLEAVQAELARTASATLLDNSAMDATARQAGNASTAKMMLEHSVRAASDSFAAGTPPTMIFAEQIGRLSEAATLSGGAFGALGEFMSGPWGIAIGLGMTALVPFIAKLVEGNHALDDAVEKLKKDADQTETTRQAKEQFQQSEEGLSAAIRAQKDATDEAIRSERTSAEQAYITAEANRAREVAVRRATAAELDAARQHLAVLSTPGASDARLAPAKEEAASAVADLEQRLIKANGDLATAESELANAHANVAAEQAERMRDPAALMKSYYDQQIEGAKAAARATHDWGKEEADIARIERDRAAATKQLQQSQAAMARTGETGRSISSAEAAGIARAAGFQVNSADRTFASQKALYDRWVSEGRPASNPVAKPGTSAHEFGNALDIQKTAGATVAKIREAFAAEGVRLTKIFSEQGHWHVEWARSAEDVQAVSDAHHDAAEAARQHLEAEKELQKQLLSFNALKDGSAVHAYDQILPADATHLGADSLSGGAIEKWEGEVRAAHDANEAIGQDRLKIETGVYNALGDVYQAVMTGRIRSLADQLQQQGAQVLAKSASQALAGLIQDLPPGMREILVGKNLKEGVGYGALGGSVFSAITGGKNNTIASEAGGALGEVAGKALGPTISKAIGGSLGKTLGGAAGPIGAVLGGVLGNVLGGLLSKPIKGQVNITGANSSSVSGSSKVTGQLEGDASNVQQGLARIAQSLGATVGAFDVAIAKRDDWYHVGGSSSVNVTAAHPTGLIYEGQDEAAAVKAAIANAVQDGAIMGISKASQAILSSGQDLDQALAKALSIESIPHDLKAMLDPVGGAIDDLNKKWQQTVAALKEGGATAEQMTQAEQLYKLQLDQVKASTASASQSLKDFLTSLKLGSDSPYSLRDQEATARAGLQPYLDQISAGSAIDQEKYQAAAKAYLDVERQLNGSTQGYFDAQDLVQAATNSAIAAIDNAVPISTPVESPFLKAAADNTASTAANTAATNELLNQVGDTLADVKGLLSSIASGSGQDLSAFIGAARNFA